jgi:hypothetical protein
MDDDLVLIQARRMRDRLARILWCAREDKSLGAVEAGRGADLALLLTVSLYGWICEVSGPQLRLLLLLLLLLFIRDGKDRRETLTPLRVALAASLAFFKPLAEAPTGEGHTDTSAIALVSIEKQELAKSAAA